MRVAAEGGQARGGRQGEQACFEEHKILNIPCVPGAGKAIEGETEAMLSRTSAIKGFDNGATCTMHQGGARRLARPIPP